MNTQKKLLWGSLGTAVLIIFGIITSCSGDSAKARPNFVFKKSPQEGAVAKIGSSIVTEDELIGDAQVALYEARKKEYEIKIERLKSLIIEKLIGEKAKAAGMSLGDYIDKKIVKGNAKASKAEFDAFIKERNIPKEKLQPQLEEKIRAYLGEQKKQDILDSHVAKLTKSNPVEVYFSKPRVNVDIPIGNSPAWGGDNAKVTIVEFSDFQCPYCSRATDVVNQVKKKYGKKIKLVFKHFPLPMHPEAAPAAEASYCIKEQDEKKFWKYHDLLFENQRALDDSNLESYAKKVGVDLNKFKECYSSKKYAETVKEEMALGEKIGVRSTPTFFINGQIITGAEKFETFAEVIDDELKTAKR